MCTVADPGFAKKGWAEKSVRVAHPVCANAYEARQRAPHTGGVQGPAVGSLVGCRAVPLPGAQGAEPPEALEFSANKGLQDGRQE